MTPKQMHYSEPEEFPLLHDAATWDDDTFESTWDDEQEQLAGELTRYAED